MMRSAAWRNVLLGGALALAALPARAQSEDHSRAVRIIEGPVGAVAPPGAAPMGTLDVRQTSIKAENPAGIELAILPDVELATGTKVVFRVATRTPGYLILVDIDATGKLSQIYPNRRSLLTLDSRETLNLMKGGQAMTIPNEHNPFAGFEFVASPPAGVAMVVAILSDRPVHMLDLPDVAPPQAGQASFDQLAAFTRQLRIASKDAAAPLQEAKWSFDAKLYVVR